MARNLDLQEVNLISDKKINNVDTSTAFGNTDLQNKPKDLEEVTTNAVQDAFKIMAKQLNKDKDKAWWNGFWVGVLLTLFLIYILPLLLSPASPIK